MSSVVVLAEHDADADGRPDRIAVDIGRRLDEVPVDALCKRNRVLAPDIAEHGREFLAAQPPEQIGGADRLPRAFGEDLQHAIADGMTETVVDRLEMIEVHQQHRRRAERTALPVVSSVAS